MPSLHFSKSKVELLPLPTERERQHVYHDDEVIGLCLRISYQGTRSYFVEGRRADGTKVKVGIGKHGVYLPDEARKRAKKLLQELSEGINHAAMKSEVQVKATTLRQVYEHFLQNRPLRTKTQSVYTSALNRGFADWLDKPVVEITKNVVERRYQELLNSKDWQRGCGEAQSNQCMRVLRVILNHAGLIMEDSTGKSALPENPVKRLTQTRAWKQIQARDTRIKPQDLRRWYKAVCKLDNDTLRDYLLVLLFTGLRRTECAKLRYSDLELDSNYPTLRIPAANSKSGREHRLPLPTFIYELLKRRSKVRDIRNPYVFTGQGINRRSADKHLVESKASINRVIAQSGIPFSPHSLRRTFASCAEPLVSYAILKRFLNHSTNGDITLRHYIVTDVEALREPMQQVCNYLMEQCGVKPADLAVETSNKVVALPAR